VAMGALSSVRSGLTPHAENLTWRVVTCGPGWPLWWQPNVHCKDIFDLEDSKTQVATNSNSCHSNSTRFRMHQNLFDFFTKKNK
jgi:hypothetical protein